MSIAPRYGRCFWCSRTYPPALKSAEHVLPDFLGASLVLPDGAVCRECNNRLNTEIDQPLKRLLQPLITHFGARSGKRSSSAPARVELQTNIGVVPATMLPGGRIAAPERVVLRREQRGNDVVIQGVCRPEDLPKFIADVCGGLEVGHVETGELLVHDITATLNGKGRVLICSAVRAACNLVALKRHDLLARDAFARARSYVLDADNARPELHAEMSREAKQGRFGSTDCRAEHALFVVGQQGNGLTAELRLFGDLFCRVRLSDQWDREPLRLHELFEVRT